MRCRPMSFAPATGRKAKRSSRPLPDLFRAPSGAGVSTSPLRFPERGFRRSNCMSLEELKTRLPDYAKDLKLNLGSLAAETLLTPQQRAGCFIACALAAREPGTTAAILAEFAPHLSAEA